MNPMVHEPAQASRNWHNGWLNLATACASPNFGPRPESTPIDLIVLHSISLPPGEFGGNAVQAFFTNTLDWDSHPYFKTIEGLSVSAHFYVRRNGEVWQFVSCDDRAWHAGQSIYRGKENCNDYSIGIELEGLEGDSFDAAQYSALAALCIEIIRNYPITHIAGHEHVAPGRKFDPGSGFDWGFLQHTAELSRQCFPDGVSKNSRNAPTV
jgi:AmpD protein